MDSSFLHADSGDSDQTKFMPRLFEFYMAHNNSVLIPPVVTQQYFSM